MPTDEQTIQIEFTLNELKQLNRIFNILGEENLRAHYFTRADIEAVYDVMTSVREGIEERELDHQEDEG